MIAPQPQRLWPLLFVLLTAVILLASAVGIAILGGGAG